MRVLAFCSIIPVVLLVTGCGGGPDDAPSLVSATGVVLYKGEPVSGANVTFIVENAPIASGSTDAEGKFSMTTGGRPGAPLGNAKVAISKASASAAATSNMTAEDMAKMAAQGQMSLGTTKEELPAKYAQPDKSGLVATLDPDGAKNVFEFRLVD